MGVEAVNACPNCKGTKFGGLGADNGNPTGVIIGAEKIPGGTYEANINKTLPITPIICEDCGYVMLFNWTVR